MGGDRARDEGLVKTYSAKTNTLAAEAVLTAAVEEAVGILDGIPVPERPDGWIAAIGNVARVRAEETLLAAGQSAELLLARAERRTA
jgi:hypothetical protein